LLEQEAEKLNEDDPRQAAHLTRKLCDITGLDLGSRMEEAIRRMEAGEDPEKIENEMGDILKEENLFNKSPKASKKAKKEPPVRDPFINL
jgi:DNA-directed RNA polymerase alpha subunit